MSKIVAAAVRYMPAKTDPQCPDFRPIIIFVPAPGRHGDILTPLSQMHETAALEAEQGFIDNHGNFLNRVEAKFVVEMIDQPTIRNTHPTQLFSEDLW